MGWVAGGDEVVSLDMSRKMDYLHCSLADSARGTVADGSDAKSENVVKRCIDARVARDDFVLDNH